MSPKAGVVLVCNDSRRGRVRSAERTELNGTEPLGIQKIAARLGGRCIRVPVAKSFDAARRRTARMRYVAELFGWFAIAEMKLPQAYQSGGMVVQIREAAA